MALIFRRYTIKTQPTFAVFRAPGSAWNHDKPMRSQDNWDAHAQFMDDLTASGFIILGGPLGIGRHQVLLIISAENEQQIRETLSRDPWEPAGLLTTQQIHPWTILLDSRSNP